MSTIRLNDTNLFAYCGNDPASNVDVSGELFNTVVGAVAGAITGGLNTCFEFGFSWKNFGSGAAEGAITGAAAGACVDFAIATGGVGGIVIAAAGGALVSGAQNIYTQKNNNPTARLKDLNWGEVALSAAVGAAGNLLSFGVSIPKARVTTGGNIFSRIWQNSKNALYENATKVLTVKGASKVVNKTNFGTHVARNLATSYANTSMITGASWAISKMITR